MKKIFKGMVNRGKVVLDEQEKYDLLVHSLNGKEIILTLSKPSKNRSNQENRYYWGVVIKILSEETGYTENETHDAMRMLFLREDTRKIITLKSTATLTVTEFEDYMSKIRTWASSELNCYIPEPNEVDY